jgi:hypothetical protein
MPFARHMQNSIRPSQQYFGLGRLGQVLVVAHVVHNQHFTFPFPLVQFPGFLWKERREFEKALAAEIERLRTRLEHLVGLSSASRQSSARHPASINVPCTGSHGSASCHGVGDARRAKTAATTACAPTAQAARANSISAGPRHVSVDASRRRTRASWEFGFMKGILISSVRICAGDFPRSPERSAASRHRVQQRAQASPPRRGVRRSCREPAPFPPSSASMPRTE